MKKVLFIVLLSATLLFGQGIRVSSPPVPLKTGDGVYSLGKFSPDGKFALLATKGYTGIELVEMATMNHISIISDAPGAGWGMRWCNSSDKFVFKVNGQNPDGSKSVSLFEYKDGAGLSKVADLSPSANNLVFYSVMGDGLLTEGETGNPVEIRKNSRENSVDYYISGGKLKVIDKNGTLNQGMTEAISQKNNVLFAEWSPSGEKLAIHAAGAGVSVIDLSTGKEYNFPKMEYPSWVNDEYLSFMSTEDDGHTIINSEVIVAKFDGTESEIITRDFTMPALWQSAAPDGTILFTGADGKIYFTKVSFLKN